MNFIKIIVLGIILFFSALAVSAEDTEKKKHCRSSKRNK